MSRQLRIELRREIRRSLPRFLSILVMVALGVLFLVGLRSAPPDMRLMADRYFDDARMYDLQIMTTLGIMQEDVDTFAAVDGVALAEGGWQIDAMMQLGDGQKVVRLLSISEQLDLPRVTKGRLPIAPDECAIDEGLLRAAEVRIGDRVRFRCAEGLEDALAKDEGSTEDGFSAAFTVTGLVQSPVYLSLNRGTGSVGDGNIMAFVLLPRESFQIDYYTAAELLLTGAAAQNAYDASYDELVADAVDVLQPLAEERGALRYETLYADGQTQIAEAWDALAQARADGEAELADAEAQLAEARQTLDDGWAQLEEGRAELDARAAAGQAELDAARAQLDDGWAQLAAGKAELDAAQQTLDHSAAEAPAQFDAAQAEIDAGRAQLAEKEQELSAARAQLDEAAEKVRAYALLLAILGEEEGSPVSSQELSQLQQTLAQGEADYAAGAQALQTAQAQLAQAQQTLDQQRDGLPAQLAAAQAEIDAGRATVAQKEAQLNDGERSYREGVLTYRQGIADGEAQLAEAEQTLKDGEAEYADGLAALAEGRETLETKLAEAEDEIHAAERKLARLARAEVYVLDRQSNYGFVSYSQNAERMANLSRLFPVIFFLVAALVCLTTMTRMVEEERTQTGAIKALGFGTGAIAAKFLGYGVLAATLGALLGCVVGTVVIPWVIYSSYNIVYNMPEFRMTVQWRLCLIASAAGIGCTVLSTLFAVLSTVRRTPAELMRPKAPKPGKRILLERVGPLWRRLRFSAKVSARNLFRYKKRLWMTVAGVAGCTALLIAGFGLRRSIFDILDLQFFDVYRFDLQVAVDPDEPNAVELVAEALDEDPLAEHYAPVMNRSARLSSESGELDGSLIATDDPAAFCELMTLRELGSKADVPFPEEGAIIDVKLAELLGLQAGDTITVDCGRPFEIPVAGVIEHYVYHYVYCSAATYEAQSGQSYRTNTFLVSAGGAEENALQLSERLLRHEGVRGVNNISATARSFRQTLQAVDSAVMVIILSAASLAFVVLYNLTNINITERVRELATIKVLGFYDGEVAMYVYRENIVLTLIGIALGQLLGRWLGRWLIGTVEMDIVMFGREITWQSHVWSIGLTLFFAALVNFLMFFRMRRIDMVQSLKSVE